MAISELGVYRNLAMNAAATALYMDGTPAIMQPGSSAALAVDDSLGTKAQATGQYRWQLQLDLGAQVVFNRLKTYMETGTYATAFDIAVSSDGSSFSTIKSVAGFGADGTTLMWSRSAPGTFG